MNVMGGGWRGGLSLPCLRLRRFILFFQSGFPSFKKENPEMNVAMLCCFCAALLAFLLTLRLQIFRLFTDDFRHTSKTALD